MQTWLIWVVIGFGLVIAELVTGTFYLLVIAIGFFVAALCASLDLVLMLQAVIGSIVAIAGVVLVHRWHRRNRGNAPGGDNLLDRGQPVVIEGWTNESAGIARVRYRGASWDARVAQPGLRPQTGSTLYIEGQEGGTLIIGERAHG